MSKKITSVLLMGGLGNQMFQYAFAKAWALENHGDYQLNTSFLEDDSNRESFTRRQYELGVFQMRPVSTSRPLVWGYNFKNRYIRFLTTRLGRRKIVNELSMRYSEDYLKMRDKKLFIGYFQSERYFSNYRKEILQDLTFAAELSEKTQALANLIFTAESVSLHVRRGDYITIQANFSHIGVCSLDYYRAAIEYVKNHTNNPTFFVFSDDIEWARENIDVGRNAVFYVDHNVGSRSYEDMYLMSHCRHNIIANSSFSWWGAWLNVNMQKIVVAPRRWFSNEKMDSSDIIPESWIKI